MTNDYAVSGKILKIFGASVTVVAMLCLGGANYVESEIGRAVFLGAFVISFLNAILVFGFIRSKKVVPGDLDGTC